MPRVRELTEADVVAPRWGATTSGHRGGPKTRGAEPRRRSIESARLAQAVARFPGREGESRGDTVVGGGRAATRPVPGSTYARCGRSSRNLPTSAGSPVCTRHTQQPVDDQPGVVALDVSQRHDLNGLDRCDFHPPHRHFSPLRTLLMHEATADQAAKWCPLPRRSIRQCGQPEVWVGLRILIERGRRPSVVGLVHLRQLERSCSNLARRFSAWDVVTSRSSSSARRQQCAASSQRRRTAKTPPRSCSVLASRAGRRYR